MEAQSCTIRRYSSRKTHQRRRTTSQRICADGQWRNCCSEMEMLFLWVTKVYWQQVAHCCAVTLLQWSNCTWGRSERGSPQLNRMTQKKGERKERGSGLRDGNCFGCMRSVWVRRSCRTVPSEGFKTSVFWVFLPFNSVFWPTGGIYTLTFIQRKCTLCVFSFL